MVKRKFSPSSAATFSSKLVEISGVIEAVVSAMAELLCFGLLVTGAVLISQLHAFARASVQITLKALIDCRVV